MKLILGLIVVVLVVDILLSGALLGIALGREQSRRSEERAQAAMDEQAEELRRGRAMDEGFDNLMRFAVNGQDGFGVGG